jgi:hypothetical protein
MRGDKIDHASADEYFSANESAPFSFAQVLVESMIGCANRKPRKDRHAILTTLIFQVEGERIIHPGELRQFRNFVYALRPLDAAIDFL